MRLLRTVLSRLSAADREPGTRGSDQRDGDGPFSSARYWESRYAGGGTSGLGSYGEFARFKARVLNEFVERNHVESVVEFGCGDGNQLSLARYPVYIGLDVSRTAILNCKKRFGDDQTKSFFLYSPECFVDRRGLFKSDLVLSLDVIYHLTEDAVFDAYMHHLFAVARRFVIVYSTDTDESPGRGSALHVRHRRFSRWIHDNEPQWRLASKVVNQVRHVETEGVRLADFHFYVKAAPDTRAEKTEVVFGVHDHG